MKNLFFVFLILFSFQNNVFCQTWKEVYAEGDAYWEKKDYKNAVIYYEQALPLAEKEFGKNSSQYANTLNDAGLCYNNQNLYAKAEPLYIEAKNIFEKILGKEHKSYIATLDNIANLYHDQNKYQEAEPLYIEIKNTREKVLGKENKDYANACNNLASLYDGQGLYAKAEPLYIEAKNIYEKVLGKEHPNYATSCNNLATLYYKQGLYAKAEPLFIEAKNIKEKVLSKEHPDYALSCNNLASLYDNQGLYAKAEILYIEAKNIREKVLGKENLDYALSCNNLGVFYKDQELYEKAEPLCIEAKNIRGRILGKEHPDYAQSCNNLASLYDKQGLNNKAIPLYIEAKNIKEKILGKEHPDYATSCNNLASLYDSQGLYAKAEPLYTEAKNIWEKKLGKNHTNYATSCSNLAELYNIQGLYSKAEPLFLESNQTLLAQINRNFSTLSEKEKLAYYNTFGYKLKKFNSFALKRYKENPAISAEVYNNTIATKALLFHTNNKIRERIAQSNDQNLKNLYQSWKDKKEYLAKIYALNNQEKEKQNIDVQKLENEANDIEKQLSQKSEIFANAQDKKQHTWKDVQKKLKINEVAIEIIRFRKYENKWTDTVKYVALIIKPESKYPEMVVLNNGNALEIDVIRQYQELIRNKIEDEESYVFFWSKINEKLQNVKKIFISLDGVYNSLNLNTLFNPNTKKYLGEEFEIQILSNTKDLLTAKKQANNNKKTVLMGFPDYNNKHQTSDNKNDKKDDKKERNFELDLQKDLQKNLATLNQKNTRFFNNDNVNILELEGTKTEIESLEQIFKKENISVQKFLTKDATEENLKILKSPNILHIATHGFFLANENRNINADNKTLGMDSKKVTENPLLRSGLLLANAKNALKDGSDGILTAYEAMNLYLDDTELVVMSACETGLGEIKNGEGVYGLQRAFQVAGAKTILMSLWTVSDEATQELMTLFYENWINKKQSKRQAFTNAQNSLKNRFPEPYYWGAFVMVGE